MNTSTKFKTEEDFIEYHKKFFDPKEVRDNLALAGLYLAAFEVLKSIIIGNTRSFFVFEFPYKGEWDPKKIRSKQYLKAIGKFYRNKNDGDEFRACGLWLADLKAITVEEAEELLAIRTERNTITHELPELLFNPEKKVDAKLLARAVALINKIDRWWILEVEVPTDPGFDDREIDEERVFSGRMMYMNHVVQMFLKNYPDLNEDALPETQEQKSSQTNA